MDSDPAQKIFFCRAVLAFAAVNDVAERELAHENVVDVSHPLFVNFFFRDQLDRFLAVFGTNVDLFESVGAVRETGDSQNGEDSHDGVFLLVDDVNTIT